MPKLPPAARLELIQAVLAAFDNDVRLLLLGHLFEAGSGGLRTSELARRVGRGQDHVRKHLIVLEQALLVQNQVGRDEGGLFSRYVMTDHGESWFERLGLREGNRAVPLLALRA